MYLLPFSQTILSVSGEVGDGEADVRKEAARQQHHALAAHELLGGTHGIARRAVVVARDHLEGTAVDATALVDLFDGQLPTFAVRLEKSRDHLVTVDLSDLDRGLRQRRGGGCRQRREGYRQSAQSHLCSAP